MPPAATYAAALPLVPAGALPLHPARDVYKGLYPLTPRGHDTLAKRGMGQSPITTFALSAAYTVKVRPL